MYEFLRQNKTVNTFFSDVHWTFPDHNNLDGSPAFCLTVVNE